MFCSKIHGPRTGKQGLAAQTAASHLLTPHSQTAASHLLTSHSRHRRPKLRRAAHFDGPAQPDRLPRYSTASLAVSRQGYPHNHRAPPPRAPHFTERPYPCAYPQPSIPEKPPFLSRKYREKDLKKVLHYGFLYYILIWLALGDDAGSCCAIR